jgi:DNA-binding transcriptional LysR family regulator
MHSVHHLELVNALAKYRHFGRAAEELGISQPALSKGLNHLESVLGVKLFDRAAPIAPTPFGDIVLQRSATLVHAFEELLREIELAKGVEFGSLAVASGIYPSEIFIQDALAELSKQRPWIQCSLIVKDWAGVMEDVLTARCDIGIADTQHASENPDLATEHIRKVVCPMFCRAGHPLTKLEAPRLEDLLQYPWVGPSLPERVGAFLPPEPLPFGVKDSESGKVIPRIRVGTFSAIRSIVLASDAISGAAAHMIRDDIASGRLVQLPVDLPWIAISYGFIWRRGRTLSPATQAFIKIARSIEATASHDNA